MTLVPFADAFPQTEFAPHYKTFMWAQKYENTAAIREAKSWILDNEERLKSQSQGRDKSDAGTGLSDDSLTANYLNFNLFYEAREMPWCMEIHSWIHQQYTTFMSMTGNPVRELWVNSWANVIRKDENFNLHHHGTGPTSYLSLNMHLGDYETKTIYMNPFTHDQHAFDNVEGGLTIFPSHVRHGVGPYGGDEPRVSIAADLLDKKIVGENASNYNDVDFGKALY